MQKIFEIEQGVPEICPWGQVSQGASVSGANVAQSSEMDATSSKAKSTVTHFLDEKRHQNDVIMTAAFFLLFGNFERKQHCIFC